MSWSPRYMMLGDEGCFTILRWVASLAPPESLIYHWVGLAHDCCFGTSHVLTFFYSTNSIFTCRFRIATSMVSDTGLVCQEFSLKAYPALGQEDSFLETWGVGWKERGGLWRLCYICVKLMFAEMQKRSIWIIHKPAAKGLLSIWLQELQNLLDRVLTDLDTEVLKSSHAFSGSSAVLALSPDGEKKSLFDKAVVIWWLIWA